MLNDSPIDGLSQYYDPHFKRQVIKIKPGEFFASARPVIIATVLGSCVSACLRDTARGRSGMNHFMLPSGSPQLGGESASLRYGIHAMEMLIGDFIKRGANRRDLEAKVFGGANVVDAIHGNVGGQNADFVVAYLRAEGIAVSAADLGGTAPRKVMCFVEDGRVLIKYLYTLNNDTIARREREYERSVRLEPASVELF